MANNKGEDLSSSFQDSIVGIKKVTQGVKNGMKVAKKAEATKIAAKAIMAAFQKMFMLIFNIMGGWIIILVFLVLLIASLACGAFNEALDINHYARDEEVMKASTNGEDRPAMEEEEIVNGYTVIRKTVSTTTGLYSSSTPSSSDSVDLTEMDDSQTINYLAGYFSQEEHGSKITKAEEYRITDEGGIIWTDPETGDEYEIAKILAPNGSPGFDFIPNYAKEFGFNIEQQHTKEDKTTYFIDSEKDIIYQRYFVTKKQDGKDIYSIVEVSSTDEKYTLGIGDKVVDYVSEVASNTANNFSEASETLEETADKLDDLAGTDAGNYTGGMASTGTSVDDAIAEANGKIYPAIAEINEKEKAAKEKKELEDNSVVDGEALMLACFQEVGYIPPYEDAQRYTNLGGAWCADFVTYIFTEIGLTDVIPKDGNTRMAEAWYGTEYAEAGYTPNAGDIVTYSYASYDPNRDNKGEHRSEVYHVGIVVGYDGENIYTIEGNTWGGYDLGVSDKNPMGTNKATELLKNVNYSCSQIDKQGLKGTIHNSESEAGVYFKIQSKDTMKERHACYLKTDVSGAIAPTTEETDASAEYDTVWITCAYDIYDSNYEELYSESMEDMMSDSYLTKIKGFATTVLNWFSNKAGYAISSLKNAFRSVTGVDLKLYELTIVPTPYTVYSEVKVDGEILYVKSGEATTTEEKTIDSYRYVKSIDGQAYYKKDGTRTITPIQQSVETGEVETVKGFTKKGIFMQSLGLEPYGPYLEASIRDDDEDADSRDSASGMTNLEYADYLYDQIVETLDLPADSSSSSTGVYAGDYIWPVPCKDDPAERAAQITSLAGPRPNPFNPYSGNTENHKGMDLGANGVTSGVDVYSSVSGTVTHASEYYGYGNCIMIKNDVNYLDYETTILYGHLSGYNVSLGDHVNQGDVIGYVGSTGRSTGPHLHFEIRCEGYESPYDNKSQYPDSDGDYGNRLDPLMVFPASYVNGLCCQDAGTSPELIGITAVGQAAEKSKTTVSDNDFDMICAIVCHESGGGYESALAVMTCVMNRVESDRFSQSTPLEVLKAPGQFSSYLDGYYTQFLNGKYTDETKQAVTDCLNGKRNHNYLNFNARQVSAVGEFIPSSGTWHNWYYTE